jgi:nucleotide-binding universal stress UspA family protein
MRALKAACVMARAFGSEIHLVHAQDRDKAQDPSPVLTKAGKAAEADGVSASSATAVAGDAFEEIMTIVDLYGADLIVTGRRGLGNISGMFAGSLSQQIAREADCAYLSVK